eukprot:Hpha_TRINITY_DN15881_c0_g1::TRINITY_DN15881_c0_g1_i1::g.190674::m.190674
MSFRQITLQKSESECIYQMGSAASPQAPSAPRRFPTAAELGSHVDPEPMPRATTAPTNPSAALVSPKARKRTVSFGPNVVCKPERTTNTGMVGGREWTYEDLRDSIRASVPLRNHTRMLRTFHLSFKGSELAEWAMQRSFNGGCDVINALLTTRVVERCDHRADRAAFEPDELYRLWEDSRHVLGGAPRDHILNAATPWIGAHPEEPNGFLVSLIEDFNTIAARCPPTRPLAADPAFLEWEQRTLEVQAIDLTALTEGLPRTTFFMNLYLLITLHARVRITDGSCFHTHAGYHIQGHIFSPADIELGIFPLRGSKNCHFPSSDVRRRFACLGDATLLQRFALCQGLVKDTGMPKVTCFTMEGLAAQIPNAAARILEQGLWHEKGTDFGLTPGLKRARKNLFGESDKHLVKFARENGPRELRFAYDAVFGPACEAPKVRLTIAPRRSVPDLCAAAA